MTMTEILAIAIAYLIGSIHFAYIVTRLVKGVDIRQIGNRNPGAANVIREVGIVPGLIVLLLDAGKGFLAIKIGEWLGADQLIILICGIAVVAGHLWGIFLWFKGGGGVATTLGIFLALVPLEFSISFIIMVIAFVPTKNFVFSFVVGMLPMPLILWAFGVDTSIIIYSIVLPLFLTIKRPGEWLNILRKLTTPEWKELIFGSPNDRPQRRKKR